MAELFSELSGRLAPGELAPMRAEGRVVLSSLDGGASETRAHGAMGIKYVAAGTEVYRYGGRSYAVSAGQFLLVPEGLPGEAEIARSSERVTLGLCVYAPPALAAEASLDAPMLFPAACSSLGHLLRDTHGRLLRNRSQRPVLARDLLTRIGGNLEPLIEDTVKILDGIEARKPSTRYETLRRLNAARSYLHEVTDRQVELSELSRLAGISRFQLLRSFRQSFGAPPAAYHRRVRLELAKAEIDRKRLSCAEAAQRFGFADSSSFSHAYRRTFGTTPSRRAAD